MRNILLTISCCALVAISALFTSCSKGIEDNPVPDETPHPTIIFQLVTEDGYWWCESEKDQKVIPAEEYDENFKIVTAYLDIFGRAFDQFPDNPQSQFSELPEVYNTAILHQIDIEDGTLPPGEERFKTRQTISFNDTTKNVWEFKGLKISKEWVDDEIAFNIHFPANKTGKDRLICLRFAGVHDNRISFGTDFLFLQKAE